MGPFGRLNSYFTGDIFGERTRYNTAPLAAKQIMRAPLNTIREIREQRQEKPYSLLYHTHKAPHEH